MKKLIIPVLAASVLAAQPAASQDFLDDVSNENIGRILGGVGGALIGSQIGDGSGQVIAVAAGALGGLFLGGEIGRRLDRQDQQGIAQTSQQALNTGQPVSWKNPDSGVQSTARVTDTSYRPVPKSDLGKGVDMVWRVPPLNLIGDDYVATATSNVRGGPSTDYAVMDQLQDGERVYVVGKAVDRNWFMIARNGIGRGFVHADLLRPAPGDTRMFERPLSTADLSNVRECSTLEQQVRLPDGTSETRQARACRTPNGKWELI